MATDNWHVIRILPELQMARTFECRDVALVSPADPRLNKAAADFPSVRIMLKGFPNSAKSKTWPCALILREGSPIKSMEPLVEFRNIVAVCCMLHSTMASIKALNVVQPLYAQQFDFYPYHPTKDPKLIVTSCYGKNSGAYATKGFKGHLNPALPMHVNHVNQDYPRVCDSLLEKSLGAWEEYNYKRKTAAGRRYIRAFSAAYAAFRGPDYTALPLHDCGIQAAFWVSSLETLAQTGKKNAKGKYEMVNISHVLDLLEGKCACKNKITCECFIPETPFLRTRKGVVRGIERRRNFLQRLYERLFDLRNRCLHGSRFGYSEIWPKEMIGAPLTRGIGPVLFHVAAHHRLTEAGYGSPRSDERTLAYNLFVHLQKKNPSKRRPRLDHHEYRMANECLAAFKDKADDERS